MSWDDPTNDSHDPLGYTKDHWPGIEIDQLRDDVECAEIEREAAEKLMRSAQNSDKKHRANYRNLKKTMNDKIAESNGELSAKSMIYLSLINEYETILGSIMEKYRVALTTPTINSLRKRGGLST
jgi:hypothetical protein